jgi:hypothetical protein
MIVRLAPWRAVSGDSTMSDKHKGMAHEHGRSVRREKIVPVAPESQQGKSPGSGAGNRQSGAGASSMGSTDAGSRGGPGSQTGGRSARQQAQRMQAQADADRLGAQPAGGGEGKQR